MRQLTAQNIFVLSVLALLAGVVLGGCRGERSDAPPRQFFPDLDDQPKWNPQTGSEMFADGRTMRPVVPGTVPFGRSTVVGSEPWSDHWRTQRADFLREDDVFYTGVDGVNADGTPNYVAKIPTSVRIDMVFLQRGQERYNIYCAVCHGYLGDGKGTVGVQLNPPASDFLDPTFLDRTNVRYLDGWIFHTIRNGKMADPNDPTKLNMPSYADKVSARDAWAIVAYVRALQASRTGTIDDVPPSLRDALMRTPQPTPSTGGTP
jgi:mono/diheme cytochrome c family protein